MRKLLLISILSFGLLSFAQAYYTPGPQPPSPDTMEHKDTRRAYFNQLLSYMRDVAIYGVIDAYITEQNRNTKDLILKRDEIGNILIRMNFYAKLINNIENMHPTAQACPQPPASD